MNFPFNLRLDRKMSEIFTKHANLNKENIKISQSDDFFGATRI